MNTGHRFKQNVVALSVLQLSNYVVPLVTVPYLVRVLRPESYGRLAFAQALIMYFDLIADYGFNLSATRAVALCRHAPNDLGARFWLTMAARIALTAASAATLAILVFCVPRLRAAPELYAAAFLTVLGTTAFPVWLFQGIEEMGYITVAHTSARLLTIPALMLWVRSPNDLVAAAAIQGSVSLWAGLLVVPVLLRKLPHRFVCPSPAQTLGVLKEGWHTFFSSAASGLNAATTVLVLGLVAGNAEVGYYSAADKVIRAVSAMLNPASQALYPRLNAMHVTSRATVLVLIRKSLYWLAALSGAASLAVILFAPLAGPMIWGPGFAPSVEVLRWLAPLPILLALINGVGTPTLLVFGFDSLVSRTALVCISINAVLTATLGGSLGAIGAALAADAAAGMTLLFLAMSLRRERLAIWRQDSAAITATEVSCPR